MSNVKGIIINGGPCNIVDGVAIDVNPSIYEAGIPVMAAGHDKATCAVKLPQFTDDIEAIKAAVKPFVFETCKAEANWNMTNFVNDQIELVRRQVGDRKVLLALSGGVDSSVVAALLLKAIGNNLVCVHVNHGLMRKGESEDVVEMFGNQLKANLIYVDVTDRFLTKLEGVEDPEQKRKIIGGEFIRVFEEEARKLDGIDFLGQGTIYPDIVESGTKTAKMVKSHHNVGGLPEDLQFELVEPLRQLSKTKYVHVVLNWACLMKWFIVNPSPVPVWACVVWVLSHAIVWKLCASPMLSCVKSFNLPDWIRKCGNISPWYPTSSQWVCATMPVLSNGRLSSVLSIRLTR